VLAAALVTWVVTVQRMRGMDAGPGTDLGSLGWYVGVWVTMMAAMMLPSALPMVLLFDRISSERTRRWSRFGSTWLFVAGYLAIWTLYGLAAFGVYRAIASLHVRFLAWDHAGPYLTGAMIVLAGAYDRWLDTQLLDRPSGERDGWLIGEQWLYSQRAPGLTCLSALEWARDPSTQPGMGQLAANDSKGCGGVMRSAPFGLVLGGLIRWQFDAAGEAAGYTHGHSDRTPRSGHLRRDRGRRRPRGAVGEGRRRGDAAARPLRGSRGDDGGAAAGPGGRARRAEAESRGAGEPRRGVDRGRRRWQWRSTSP